jgi:hypothetical protein
VYATTLPNVSSGNNGGLRNNPPNQLGGLADSRRFQFVGITRLSTLSSFVRVITPYTNYRNRADVFQFLLLRLLLADYLYEGGIHPCPPRFIPSSSSIIIAIFSAPYINRKTLLLDILLLVSVSINALFHVPPRHT